MRTLVLGLGNPILGDDGVGLAVAEAVQEKLISGAAAADSAVEVDTECNGGLQLMERLIGYDRAIIVDAIVTGSEQPGTVQRLVAGDLPTLHSGSAHDVTLPVALRLATRMGLKVPEDIAIIAIEAVNVFDFDEHLTPAVAAAVPVAAEAVLACLKEAT
jgi:hydrogenase maturation protease